MRGLNQIQQRFDSMNKIGSGPGPIVAAKVIDLSSLSALLPDYGCLVLSPANIWRRDSSIFQSDANLVDTVFQLQRSREGHSSLADLMFGLRQRDTGITKYPVNNRWLR